MPSIMERVFQAVRPQPALTVTNPGAVPAPAAPNPTANPAEPPLPLDQFKDMWKTEPVDPKNAPQDPFATPLINIDQKTINEQVAKMNFLDGVPAELLTKATTGDMGAFSQVLNTAVQKAMAASLALNGSMIEGATNKNNDRVNSTLAKRMKEQQLADTRASNDVLNHEAAAPMLDMAKRTLMAKHPTKSATEINQMAEDMMTTFASSLVQSKEVQAKPKGKDSSDFSDW